MTNCSRRPLLFGAAVALVLPSVLRAQTAAASAAPALPPLPRAGLPPMTDGPFYPGSAWRLAQSTPSEPADWDADLTQLRRGSRNLRARGEHLGLELMLVDSRGRTIDGAEIEIWQCDALAAYRHPSVQLVAEQFDAGFQGFGAARTGTDGGVAFRTIRPVPYPGRTPHIHIKLRHASFGEQTSQLFVAGEPGNARDFLWRQLDAAGQAAAAMTMQPAEAAGAAQGLRWRARHAVRVPA